MDDILKMLAEIAAGNAKVEVHKMDKDGFEKFMKEKMNSERSKSSHDEAAEIAHLNRILYEAHIKEGFTSEEALALTVATIQ